MYDQIFQQQLNQHLVIIFRYLMKHGATKQDAEDIVQDAALKYMQYIESIPDEQVKSWLFRVAMNRYYDILRKQKVNDKSLVELRILEHVEQGLPEEYLIKMEEKNDVVKTLELLHPRYREFLILKYVIGLRYEDIAHSFQVSVGTVKATVFRAKQQFIDVYRRGENE